MEQWEVEMMAELANSLAHLAHCPDCRNNSAIIELGADAIYALWRTFIAASRKGRFNA